MGRPHANEDRNFSAEDKSQSIRQTDSRLKNVMLYLGRNTPKGVLLIYLSV